MRLLCNIFLPILLLSRVTPAATYFLSPDGDDGNLGTAERPWRTLAKANTTLLPGDTVILADDMYEGVIEPARSGRDGAAISYRARSAHGAIVTSGRASDGISTCVRLKNRDHILVDGLKLLPKRGGWMQLDSANHCMIESRKSTPYELNLGWAVKLDRDPFIGQRALRDEKRRGRA